MTPLQIMLLGKKMREAQKRYFAKRDNIAEAKALEKQFDQAIEPYIDYAASLEDIHDRADAK